MRNKLTNALVLLMLVFSVGCTADSIVPPTAVEETNPEMEVASKKGNTAYSFGNPLGESEECTGEYRSTNFELFAGQTNPAGFVNISTDCC